MVQAGERIISKGVLVNGNTFRILQSLKREYETKLGDSANSYIIILGQFILVFVSILVVFLFLYHFRREILHSILKTSFILLMIVLVFVFSRFIIKYNLISFYIIPFAILPIMVTAFYDARLAFFIHVVTLLLVGFIAPNSFEFVFLNFIVGIIAIFNLTNLYRRRKIFVTAALIVLSYSVGYLGMAVIQEISQS